MSNATTKMSMRHVLLIVTGIMLTFGCSALTFSTWTNFQPVVTEAMGLYTPEGKLNTAPFALYITVLYLTMTIASPFAGKLIQKMDIRIILSVSAALVGCAFLLMSVYTE
ncbi:MAG: MFS transporter, partial [Berryella intestinalis]|nr:MFS transporter [Berryella intestinalis]